MPLSCVAATTTTARLEWWASERRLRRLVTPLGYSEVTRADRDAAGGGGWCPTGSLRGHTGQPRRVALAGNSCGRQRGRREVRGLASDVRRSVEARCREVWWRRWWVDARQGRSRRKRITPRSTWRPKSRPAPRTATLPAIGRNLVLDVRRRLSGPRRHLASSAPPPRDFC